MTALRFQARGETDIPGQQTGIHTWPSEVGVGWLLSRHTVGTFKGKQSSHATWGGNAHPQLSQQAEPLWTDSGQSVEMVCTSWSPLTKQKGRQGMICTAFPPNPRMWGKSHHHYTTLKITHQLKKVGWGWGWKCQQLVTSSHTQQRRQCIFSIKETKHILTQMNFWNTAHCLANITDSISFDINT